MSDDIVQKIVIQAEDQATPALDKIGESAGKATQGAADGMGKLGSVVAELAPTFAKIALAVVAAGAALAKMALSAADTGEQMGKLQQATGGTAEALSGLVLTFSSFGTSSQTAATAIENFSHKVSEAARTAAVDTQASADKVADAQIKSSNLATKQLELDYAARKLLYGQDVSAQEQRALALQKIDDEQAQLTQERKKATEEALNAAANDLASCNNRSATLGPSHWMRAPRLKPSPRRSRRASRVRRTRWRRSLRSTTASPIPR